MKTISLLIASLISTWAFASSYYVAKTGDDTNTGTSDRPFLTINAAASVANAGDTCYIGAGTYRETLRPANSGSNGDPIVFMAVPGEAVVISAMEPLMNWSLDAGMVYKTTVDWSLGQKNFVIHENTACDLARWPNNTDGNPFTPNAHINTGGSPATTTVNAYLDYADGIPNYDWDNGGSIYYYCMASGSGWTSWRAWIKSNSTNRVTFDLPSSWIGSAHPPASLGEFYLQGIKDAIDYDNEWYYNATDNLLYIQIPGGGMPADSAVQMRKREYTIDLSNREYIEVRNLAVFGGSVELTGASNYNTLYGLSVFYGDHSIGVLDHFVSNSQSVNITGSNNRVEKCEVSHGSGTGIWVAGSYNSIINCNIHDFDFICDYDAPLMARNGNNTTVRNNTIYRGGRDCVQWFNRDSDFSYNKVYQSNLLADDCALIYTVGGPFHGEIHHNWFFDTQSRGNKYKAAGIYLDNDAEAFEVHHNVVYNTEWSSIQINLDAKDLNIYNNTLWEGAKAMDAWHREGTSFTNINVWNNLADNNNWESQADKQNNLALSSSPFVDLENFDFMPAAGSAPIDYGREISGITDGFIGAAPDVGAYEYGGDNWTAGIDWNPLDGPTGIGCYGLPGDPCDSSMYTSLAFPEKTVPETVGIDLYPNPATTTIHVVFPEIVNKAALCIYTTNGILVQNETVSGKSASVSINALQPGLYLMQIHKQEQVVNKRFIKDSM